MNVKGPIVLLAVIFIAACGPQSDPKDVARDWLEARFRGDCDTVLALSAHDYRRQLERSCAADGDLGDYVSVRIDEVVMEDDPWFANTKWVHFYGDFEVVCSGTTGATCKHDSRLIFVEEIEGKWYVVER